MTEPGGTGALLAQGIAAAKAGRKEEAKETLLRVLDQDERNEQAWLWLSGVVDSVEEKRICLENVLAINPGNSRAQAGLDYLRQAQPPARPAPAEEERCPRCEAPIPASANRCPRCALPLIVACPNCGEYAGVEEARCPHCEQTLGDFRQGAAYHLGLARMYLERQKPDRALEALGRTEDEAGTDPSLLAHVAALYETANRPEEAIAAYEQVLEHSPADPVIHARLGSLYRRRGDTARAQAMYERAAELGGGDPAVNYELARLHLEGEGSPEQAIALLQRAVAKQRMDGRAYLLLGDAYLRLGNPQEAVKNYQWAVKFSAADSTISLEAQRKLAEIHASYPQAAPSDRRGVARGRAPRQRPGCVSLYAILLGIGAALSLVSGLCVLASMATGQFSFEEYLSSMDESLVAAGQNPFFAGETMDSLSKIMNIAVWVGLSWGLVSAVVNGFLAFGLWGQRNWARIGVIILGILGILGSFAQVALSMTTMRQAVNAMSSTAAQGMPLNLTAMFVCPGLLVVAVQAYIVFWFYANRDAFYS